MRVLVMTAHADDLEVHASGLVMRMLDAGHIVTSVVTTYGLRDQKIKDREARETRIEESTRAHALIGLTPHFHLAEYEQELSTHQSTRAKYREYVLGLKPDAVITHWPIDANPDHRTTALLAMEPCYQLGVNTEILFFEALSSGRARVDLRPQSMYFLPSHYCAITDELAARKKALIDCHVSQDPDGMWYGQENLHRNRGAECIGPRAEAYIAAKRYGALHTALRDLLHQSPRYLPRPIGIDFKPGKIGLDV